MKLTNPWKILGVNRQSTAADISWAYKRLAQDHHPDKGGDTEKFAEVAEAHNLLRSSKLLSEYIRFIVTLKPMCGQCKGKGVVFKQRGIIGREASTCDYCSGAGVIF